LTGTRSGRELGLALRRAGCRGAGYRGAFDGHIVSNPPLLIDVFESHFRGQRYCLRRGTE